MNKTKTINLLLALSMLSLSNVSFSEEKELDSIKNNLDVIKVDVLSQYQNIRDYSFDNMLTADQRMSAFNSILQRSVVDGYMQYNAIGDLKGMDLGLMGISSQYISYNENGDVVLAPMKITRDLSSLGISTQDITYNSDGTRTLSANAVQHLTKLGFGQADIDALTVLSTEDVSHLNYINEHFPKDGREDTTKLDITTTTLDGYVSKFDPFTDKDKLDISDFKFESINLDDFELKLLVGEDVADSNYYNLTFNGFEDYHAIIETKHELTETDILNSFILSNEGN